MIYIINDPDNLLNNPEIKVVSHISEYPEIYDHILHKISNNLDEKIIVNSSIIMQFLKNIAKRYPQHTFVFEIVDAHKALSERWQVILPRDVTNDEITNSGLLGIDLQPKPGQNFTDIVLTNFYNHLLGIRTFPFTRITAFLDEVSLSRWRENRTDTLLARIFNQRVEEWSSQARSTEQRMLIDLFAENPEKLRNQLMQFRVLSNYPDIGEMLLDDLFPVFSSLKLPLHDLEIDETGILDTVLQVTYYLNSMDPKSEEEIKDLISKVSGLLWIEFETIENHLVAHPVWITPALIDELELKFEEITYKISRHIKNLRNQISPTKPDSPDADWGIDRMLEWATETYLPYQKWCLTQNKFNPEIFEIGDKFSEWMINNWHDLHANSNRMIFNILPSLSSQLKQKDIVNLILVIDNLGWFFSQIVADLFQKEGYFISAREPYLAMVPTETETSKKCLLSGSTGYTEIDNKQYKDIIQQGWVPYFNDSEFQYTSDLGKLKDIETIEASTYVVNYLAVDSALHKSENEIGIPHHEHIVHLLEKLIENVIEFIDKHSLSEIIRIHVVSDHGSTKIPTNINNGLDPKDFKADGYESHSHRYLEVSDAQYDKLVDNLSVDCFILPKNEFLLEKSVICARRANRFLKTDQSFYVHGGLLPEEVVVPYLFIEPRTIPTEDLTVLLLNNEFRFRKEKVNLEIGNPNDFSVEQIYINILNSNVVCEPIVIPNLPGKSNTTVEVDVKFNLASIPDDQTHLRLKIRFHCRDERFTLDIKKPITMRKFVDQTSPDIFNELE